MLPNVLKRQRHEAYPSVWDNFFTNDFFPSFFNTDWNNSNTPAVNVEESEKAYNIEVAVPGLDKKDFSVNVDNDVLTISSKNENKKEEKKDGYLRREFSYNSFSRSFTLPEHVEADKIKATYKNGVLNVELPKSEQVTLSKEIKIS